MLKFTLKRLASLVVVLIGVSFLVFMLLSLTPGDPVRMMLGESATPEAQEALREEMGLNDSAPCNNTCLYSSLLVRRNPLPKLQYNINPTS